MTNSRMNRKLALYATILAAGLLAPFLFPAYTTQVSYLWVMIILASTWDMQGGQMGYNSLGNIFFFGAGMYVSAVIQVAPHTDLRAYTAAGEVGEALVLTSLMFLVTISCRPGS